MSQSRLCIQWVCCGLWLALSGACAASSATLANDSGSGADRLQASQTYTVTSSQSHLAMTESGDSVTQDSPTGAVNQQWTLQEAAGDANETYSLISVATGQALALPANNATPGTRVQVAAVDGSTNQSWQLEAQPDGSYTLVNSASSQCLDDPSASNQSAAILQQWTCAKSLEMHWLLQPAGNSNSQASPAPASPTTRGTYSMQQLTADLNNVLQLRAPIYSSRNLGNPSMVAKWTPDKVQSLYNGILTAQQFYANLALTDLAHLIVAEGAQESTGDYDLPGYSQGFLQVTPPTVGLDFNNHGLPVLGPNQQPLIAPNGANNTYDPGQNVAFWAWYTYNVVAAGESLNEVALGQKASINRDFGNAEFDWLAGPHNDRHNPAQAPNYQDYHDRIKDYFVQSQFGTAEQFENLLNTPVGSSPIDTH